MKPKEYALENGYEYKQEVWEKGVCFAEFTDGTSVFYMRVFDGVVHPPKFTEVGHSGQYTFGKPEGEPVKRMVDDEGVHEPIQNY